LQLAGKNPIVLACAAALSLLLAACGGGGGGNSQIGNGLTPFPTEKTDELPPGARIDVSSKNLFQMGAGDTWNYLVIDANGNPTPAFASRTVTSDDGAGHVTLVDNDNGSSTTNYTVSADGLLDSSPLDGAPASAVGIVGGIFEYATPLYPVGAVRRHVRSGPWGEDLDGDGIGESFRLEFAQTFVGFETLQLSPSFTVKDVAHFHNVFALTLRPTDVDTTDYTITATEDTWFAPGLGMLKAQRTTIDSDLVTLEPPHTLVFTQGLIGGVNWDAAVPLPVLDGVFIDVPLKHNALVYDSLRNLYYASVPGSVAGNGNSIATIDPASGHVSYSATVGLEPNALAIAADASVLYVGLDGSGEVARLTLPSLAPQGRTQLVKDALFGQSTAQAIAVSPVDAAVAAVSMTAPFVALGTALLRDMALQPKTTPQLVNNSFGLTFDAAGTTLYAVGGARLRSNQVLADGLLEQLVIVTPNTLRALGFAGGRVLAGNGIYDPLALTLAGSISTPSECVPRRSDGLLLCFASADLNTGQGRVLLADPDTFVIRASLGYATSEPGGTRRLVEGQAGQIAISYPVSTFGSVSKIRLYTSAGLLTPPAPPAPSWPVTVSSTPDGTARDVGIVHNSLVYDSGRNVYYASVPGSVIGAGNSIATIDPATGQVAHSAPIGSEPNALAISADGSALYVGLDGSGEVARLALPSLAPQGRARLIVDSFLGITRAETIAVSPADAGEAVVSMAYSGVSPRHAGAALLRDLVMQPKRTQANTGSNLVAFDSTGTKVYGQNIETGESGLRRIGVLPDGLAEELVVVASNHSFRGLSFANGQVIDGATLYDAPALTAAGAIPGASDCWPTRSGTGLLCITNSPFAPSGQGTLLLADSTTLGVGASLRYALSEPDAPRRLVQGPSGQIAVSYVPFVGAPSVRLFSSAKLP
jgi:hypothetical protein